MERYLDARENTDALIFNKAANPRRQNHATPLSAQLNRAPVPAAAIQSGVRLRANAHANKQRASVICHNVCECRQKKSNSPMSSKTAEQTTV